MGDTKNKRFLTAAFTLSGTIVGAGILGLPYVFAQSGFFIGMFWILFLGMIMILINLYMGEITLRTKNIHHLPGYAERFIGEWGKRIMMGAIIFGIYSALLAYLIGEGQSLSQLFTGSIESSFFFGVFFWLIMVTFLQGGLNDLKKLEYWGVWGIIFVVFIAFILLFPQVSVDNLTYIDVPQIFLPFGVVLFSLIGFLSIPELRRELGRDKELMKKSILLGAFVPVILYIILSLVFVGVAGDELKQVATLSFSGGVGNVLLILGIFTMFTSYFVLSFALKDYFFYDLKRRKLSFFFTSVFPLALYLIVYFFDLAGFVTVLGLGGVVTGGVAGILILIMNLKAKEIGDRKPEYSIPLNKIAIGILTLIFIVGIFFEFFGSLIF
ncbi:MAG: aromatic amino acid transport family protein [Candidatus Pacearchaeota archaeon]